MIAVALFAALSYAIAKSSRGGAPNIAKEQQQLDAALDEQCVGYVERGEKVLQIINGCPADQLSYELPNGDNENSSNPSNTNCFLFHSNGAGLTACRGYLVVTTPACTGAEVGGYCWYYGTAGQSCTTVCLNAGKSYDTATQSYAGSAGTNAQCGAVLTATGAAGSGNSISEGACGLQLGCYWSNEDNRRERCTNFAATAGASWVDGRRACACQ